jgi:hypothetical protein
MAITEYQLPIEVIRRLPKTHQPRVQDCSETSVIEKAEQMKGQKGQTTGICVGMSKEFGFFDCLWGNTRLRSAKVLAARSEKISNCAKDHIWVSLYEHPLSQLRKFQAIENNIHDVVERATNDDNIGSINSMIIEGEIPGYADMLPEEQRAAVKKLYTECQMPSHKFTSVWNKIKKINKQTSKKMRTWDKPEISVYFGNNNDYGITTDQCNESTKSGTVFDVIVDGKPEKLAVYFVSKSSEFGGATLANSNWTRNIHKHSTKVVVVTSLNDTKGNDIAKSRKSVIKKIEKWNPSLKAGKSIDRIMFVPQTEKEQENELIAGKFLVDQKF